MLRNLEGGEQGFTRPGWRLPTLLEFGQPESGQFLSRPTRALKAFTVRGQAQGRQMSVVKALRKTWLADFLEQERVIHGG
ncbi:MAG TPA: hypothetical protein PKE47_00460 [Verrucomicrobiota bacterium]|nr:hypothetical protein [Verrucomicrobiota bacterium]